MGMIPSKCPSDEDRLEKPRGVDMELFRQPRRAPAHHPCRPGNIDRTFGYEPFVDTPQDVANREGCWLQIRNDGLEDSDCHSSSFLSSARFHAVTLRLCVPSGRLYKIRPLPRFYRRAIIHNMLAKSLKPSNRRPT